MYNKRDEKKPSQYLLQIFKENGASKEKKEYQKCYHEREKGNSKSVIKETRKNKYKSQTRQCDDINNRQKRNCKKKIHAQRKIGGKLKSKKLADIQCNTQIKNVKCAEVNGTQNCNRKKKYVTYSNKDIIVRVANSINDKCQI